MILLSRVSSSKIKKLKTRMLKSTLKTVNYSCLIWMKWDKLGIRIEFKTKIQVFTKRTLPTKIKMDL
jgi:hypothetical protein